MNMAVGRPPFKNIKAGMKDARHTLLTVFNHIAVAQPELIPAMEKILFQLQGKQPSDAELLLALNKELLAKSKSQLRQDLFVLSELNYKRDGFFVEFGATNGVDLSNTFLLETAFGWSGILAEPALRWHDDLVQNRRAQIDKRCVWSHSNESVLFNETDAGELSTINALSGSDMHAEARKKGRVYQVNTVSLMDLLEEHGAPAQIDYLSIDTEGSEYAILESFDFNRYRFKVITCEHNYTPLRDKLYALLVKNGYRRKFEKLSLFDDWWVSEK